MKTKTTYVDGFVFVIPKKNINAYKKMAREGKQIWMKFGALDYKECMGADLKTVGMDGKPAPMTFLKLTKAKPSDTVWFSYVTYKSKAHCDAVNKKVMAYFDKKYTGKDYGPMPFDERRMAKGGFSVKVG